MLKRVTLLEKKANLTHQEFTEYWLTTHAALARTLPGLERYHQNHVVKSMKSPSSSLGYQVDGIVELWNADQILHEQDASSVMDDLVIDEQKVFGGLTGAVYAASVPHDSWPYKVWILGHWRQDHGGGSASGPSMARILAGMPTPLGVDVNGRRDDEEILTRETLRAEPEMPEVAFGFGYAEADAHEAFNYFSDNISDLDHVMDKVNIFLTKVISIPIPESD